MSCWRDGLEITCIGTLYKGPWEKKYWSSSRGKDRHPYPIGYQAMRKYSGLIFKMEIKEGSKGPAFMITSEEGLSCCGETPTIAWENISKRKNLRIPKIHSKIDAAELFGFTNALVQRMFRELLAKELVGTVQNRGGSHLCEKPDNNFQSDCLISPVMSDKGSARKKRLKLEKQKFVDNPHVDYSFQNPDDRSDDNAVENGVDTKNLPLSLSVVEDTEICVPDTLDIAQDVSGCRLCIDSSRIEGGSTPVTVVENAASKNQIPVNFDIAGKTHHFVPDTFDITQEENASTRNLIIGDIEKNSPFNLKNNIHGTSIPLISDSDEIAPNLKASCIDKGTPIHEGKDSDPDAGLGDTTCNMLCCSQANATGNKDFTQSNPSEIPTRNIPEKDPIDIREQGFDLSQEFVENNSTQSSDGAFDRPDSDSMGQELAKSMMTVLLPQALPLLEERAKKKRKISSEYIKGRTSGNFKLLGARQTTGSQCFSTEKYSEKPVNETSEMESLQLEPHLKARSTEKQYAYKEALNTAVVEPCDLEETIRGTNKLQEFCKRISKENLSDVHELITETAGFKGTHSRKEGPAISLPIEQSEALAKESCLQLNSSRSNASNISISTTGGCAHSTGTVDLESFVTNGVIPDSFEDQNLSDTKTEFPSSIQANGFKLLECPPNETSDTDLECKGMDVHQESTSVLKSTNATKVDSMFIPGNANLEDNGIDKEMEWDDIYCSQVQHANGNERISHPYYKGTIEEKGKSVVGSQMAPSDIPSSSMLQGMHNEMDVKDIEFQQLSGDIIVMDNDELAAAIMPENGNLEKSYSPKKNDAASHADKLNETKMFGPVACYEHPIPVISLLVSVWGNSVHLCVVCGYSEERERTIFLYSMVIKEDSCYSSDLHGFIEAVFPGQIEAKSAVDKYGLQLTPDGENLVLTDAIKIGDLRDSNDSYPGSKFTLVDCSEDNGVNLVSINEGNISMLAHFPTTGKIYCILVCAPQFIIAAGENGGIQVLVMDYGWRNCVEDFFLPGHTCVLSFICELLAVPHSRNLVVGHYSNGDYAIWDIAKRVLLTYFNGRNFNIIRSVIVDVFTKCQHGKINKSSMLCTLSNQIDKEKHFLALVCEECSVAKEQHLSVVGAAPLISNKENIVVSLFVFYPACKEEVKYNTEGEHLDTNASWRMALLQNDTFLVGDYLDGSLSGRASAVTSLSEHGLVGTSDGVIYIWEVMSGKKVLKLQDFKGVNISCISTDITSSVFAVAGSDNRVFLYMQFSEP